MIEDDRLRDLVAEVAAAYFSNSHVSPREISHVISQIATGLSGVTGASSALDMDTLLLGSGASEQDAPGASPRALNRRVIPLRAVESGVSD